MSAVADTLNQRVHIANPKPGFCSGCYQGAQESVEFVDFNVAHDSGQVITERDGVVTSRITGDDLYLCGQCVKEACEALGLKPELHAQQVQLIKRLELERDHWRDYAKRQEETLNTRPRETAQGR